MKNQNTYTAPKNSKANNSSPPPSSPTKSCATTLPVLGELSTCDVVEFVLKSGAALELKVETIFEVVEPVADRLCRSVCGCLRDGRRTSIPVENIDYFVESVE